MTSKFDPVRLEILWGGLTSIAEEMGITLKRTAYSEMVREANDFSCALFDEEGNMIAQTDYIGSPGHLGSVRDAVREMLKVYPLESLQPGDSLLTNDPYLVAGHLPDIAVATPIFRGGRVIAFAVNITHHTDIGGRVAGGHIADSREIFEEGVRIPISKLYEAGKPNRDVLKIIESNVRVPYKELGDFNAQLSSNFVASKRLSEFIDDFKLGLDDLKTIFKQVIQTAEAAMRDSIRQMPSGTFEADEEMESFDGNESIPLKVSIKITDDRLMVDFAGTGKQSPQGINSPYNYTFAYTSHAVKCATNPSVPMNEGVMKTIDLKVPEGSILNPRFPAAVGGRHLTNWRVNSLVFRALAKFAPERVIAPSGGTGSNMPQFSGIDSRTGRPFVQIVNHSGGLGARPMKDGIHCYPFPARAENTPLEIVESVAPLTIQRLELAQDSGGAGKFRGGSGILFEVRIDNPDGATLLNISGRDRFTAQGVFGGLSGQSSEILLRKNSGWKKLHPRKIVHLEHGDYLRFRLPGGGGYGDPSKRDPELVSTDVLNDLVSKKHARSMYKVVLNKSGKVMEERTKQLRKGARSRGA
ncbi:MAG: hydantoinase B/oxoprolinase family protein [Thaumarchaeota archaeon]|nr:hydantoinase B/oxoprolinase family protein [Nitrososphaerota archaeon]